MRFRDLPVKWKLILTMMWVSMAALLAAGAMFFAYEYFSVQALTERNLEAIGRILAANSTAALSFEDAAAADKTLSVLSVMPSIEAASLYDTGGNMLASYVRGKEREMLSEHPGPDGFDKSGNHLVLFSPVLLKNERIGTIYLRSDYSQLYERLWAYVEANAGIIILSSILTFVICVFLQRSFLAPVAALAETARQVSFTKDYSLRCAKHGKDELGFLIDQFNEMLNQVQARDAALRRINDDLTRQTAELNKKTEEVEAFVYIVSHDLRAPLVNLQGFSRELQLSYQDVKTMFDGLSMPEDTKTALKAILEHDVPDALQYIIASSGRFERLINALLALSRLGRQEYQMQILDIPSIVNITMDAMKRDIETAGAEIMVHPLPQAFGDPTAIEQVFANLIGNALKYRDTERKERIEIFGEKENGMTHFRIKDNGLGMNMSAQKRLFQIFQRFHPTKASGDGMGLATIKRIVERHQGKVWAESEEGTGSTFHFLLPYEKKGSE